jgi:molybdopterin molybdotransferase
MISVEQAINIVSLNVSVITERETLPLNNALNRVLSKNVISQINMPPFRQSAMDGYAVNVHSSDQYLIIDEVKAGDSHQPNLKPGEATRIFTGAPVPDTANAIIIQEHTSVKYKYLTANRPVTHNANIRPLGEQIKKGDIALKAGTELNAAGVAFLTSLGFTEAEVYKNPSIGIVVTGNELVKAGQPLKHGQIYESNAVMLASALHSLDYINVEITTVEDNYESTFQELKKMLNKHDMLLVSGGISVGDYDFVGKALLELGVEQLFYKVKQKPGKPLFFGKKDETYVFALPGNPASALSCFYVYVNMAMQRLSGNLSYKSPKIKAKSVSNFIKKGDRAQFLKAIHNNGEVQILEGQNSSMIHTFALANALVYIPETTSEIKVNDTVNVILLPIN